ncbi:helix-turn-helix transcriptional regulator [Variovorax sp. OV329]|uniref:ArsR/SmtB family transcription factor n=1 Tax=Variovorax sp. OV329 TaxID=1882825 RepID=UPI0008EA8228|nr:winged helix-turn-helix domain-containing protein [Variovorax sp. OV329]SFN07758.1 DNA-binding transcriptional regulator, ArsR family [Variovorax sp. OV329]
MNARNAGQRTQPEEDDADLRLARLASAIAEPARARMLCSLLDRHARTATELAVLAEVAPSTASAHLAKLREQGLVETLAQGKHRYFRLSSREVAAALEALQVVAGTPRQRFKPSTPSRLRLARTCYDHMAGAAGVALHDHLQSQGWLGDKAGEEGGYELTSAGERALQDWGVDVEAARARRRRFACACVDWSERRPHLGGALAAAWLELAVRRGWVRPDLDSRALALTPKGRREMPFLVAAEAVA